MCMQDIRETPKKFRNKRTIHEGWKVFNPGFTPDSVRSECMSGRYKLDKWVQAKGKRLIIATEGDKYQPGFHIFTTRKGAVDWAEGNTDGLTKVRFRHVTGYGKHYTKEINWISQHTNCVVAQEMYVPSKNVKVTR